MEPKALEISGQRSSFQKAERGLVQGLHPPQGWGSFREFAQRDLRILIVQ